MTLVYCVQSLSSCELDSYAGSTSRVTDNMATSGAARALAPAQQNERLSEQHSGMSENNSWVGCIILILVKLIGPGCHYLNFIVIQYKTAICLRQYRNNPYINLIFTVRQHSSAMLTPCISNDRNVRLSVCHTLALSENDAS